MPTLLEKAAGLVFPRLGSNMNPPVRATDDMARFKDLLNAYPFGGLVLFNGDVDHMPALLAELQDGLKTPLLIGSDIERGTGQQIKGATLFPHARALAEAGLPAVRSMAQITAIEARLCGLHITFAPVADVNSDPRNPIIGIRAFGADPKQVSAATAAYIQACKAEGLFTTAKHFPGHGNTATDSHESLPEVDSDLDELHQTDIAPFAEAIQNGVDLVMTAHVAFPALDPVRRPATLSKPILDQLLRNQLKFEGPVITDSLIMGAVDTDPNEIARFAADALNAGVDILLDPPDPPAMVKGIIQAVENKLLPENRIDDALQRIDTLRQKGPTGFPMPADKAEIERLVGAAAHREEALRIAETVLRNSATNSAFQFAGESDLLCIYIKPYKTHLDPVEEPMGEMIRAAFPASQYAEVDSTSSPDTLEKWLSEARNKKHILAPVVTKPAAWRSFGLPDNLATFLRQLVDAAPTTLVAMGDSRILEDYENTAARACTFSDVPASQEALVRWLTQNDSD